VEKVRLVKKDGAIPDKTLIETLRSFRKCSQSVFLRIYHMFSASSALPKSPITAPRGDIYWEQHKKAAVLRKYQLAVPGRQAIALPPDRLGHHGT